MPELVVYTATPSSQLPTILRNSPPVEFTRPPMVCAAHLSTAGAAPPGREPGYVTGLRHRWGPCGGRRRLA